jgi:hypothetical protein
VANSTDSLTDEPQAAIGVFELGSGTYKVGQFLGYREAAPRTVGAGTPQERTFKNCDLGLLVGGRLETVQYPSKAAAVAAMGGTLNVDDTVSGGPRKDELVCVPVAERHGVGKDGRGYLFWVSATAAPVDPSQFDI